MLSNDRLLITSLVTKFQKPNQHAKTRSLKVMRDVVAETIFMPYYASAKPVSINVEKHPKTHNPLLNRHTVSNVKGSKICLTLYIVMKKEFVHHLENIEHIPGD